MDVSSPLPRHEELRDWSALGAGGRTSIHPRAQQLYVCTIEDPFFFEYIATTCLNYPKPPEGVLRIILTIPKDRISLSKPMRAAPAW